MYISTLTATFLSLFFIVFMSCSDNSNSGTQQDYVDAEGSTAQEVHPGMITPAEVEITTPLNVTWVDNGKKMYDLKCQSCHKLNDERIVGPGWSGITTRREPVWIMNMITNVDVMLEKDPEAQKLLEMCLVRMPNQNVTKEEARHILEFMRHNDGVK